MFVAACGDDGGNTKKMDAGVIPDTTEIDAAPTTPVKLTVTSAGVGKAGVRVHFQNPDSTLILSTNTDANGVASAVMPNGGYVTAVNPYTTPGVPSVDLKTFAGVKPGDELVLKESLGGQVTDVTVTGQEDTDGTVTDYWFSTSCADTTVASPGSGSMPQATLGLYGGCLPNTDYVIASLDTNGAVVHFAYAPNTAVSGTTVDLSATALATSPTSKAFTFNNIPVAANGVEFIDSLSSAEGEVVQFTGNGTGTTVTQTIGMTPFTNAVDVVLGMVQAPYGFHGLADWSAFSTTYTTDVGARLLTEATSGVEIDVAARKLTWTEATGGQTPEFALANIYSYRSTLGIYWTISAPYSAGMVQLPTLPVEGTDYNFQATDTNGVDNVVIGKVPGGYDAVRESLQSLNGPQDLAGGGTPGALTFEQITGASQLRHLGGLLGKLGMGSRNRVAPAWPFRRRM